MIAVCAEGASVHWAFGDSPKDWYVYPLSPNNADTITFQHPFDEVVYTDSCAPVEAWGVPQVDVNQRERLVAVYFIPETPGFCLDASFSGLVGDLGRLAPGEWTLLTPLGEDTFFVDALLAGDANRDNVVDVSDFNVWNSNRFTFETTWDTADFNGDGVTDTLDFNIWNQNKFTYGNRLVPEPATSILLVGSFFVALLRRRCRATSRF
jgi:hypothetical protein